MTMATWERCHGLDGRSQPQGHLGAIQGDSVYRQRENIASCLVPSIALREVTISRFYVLPTPLAFPHITSSSGV